MSADRSPVAARGEPPSPRTAVEISRHDVADSRWRFDILELGELVVVTGREMFFFFALGLPVN